MPPDSTPQCLHTARFIRSASAFQHTSLSTPTLQSQKDLKKIQKDLVYIVFSRDFVKFLHDHCVFQVQNPKIDLADCLYPNVHSSHLLLAI